MKTLRLGHVDKGNLPSNTKDFLKPYHPFMSLQLKNLNQFRDEANMAWRPFQELSGSDVKKLQQFLKESGFMPKAEISGIFGYGTAAAVRLFQHYTRFVDGFEEIGTPDGIVGATTWKYIEQWQNDPNKNQCIWGESSAAIPTPEFIAWLVMLEKGKDHLSTINDPLINPAETFGKSTDTKKLKDWDVDPESVHLIGIRRGEEHKENNLVNNDLFVLLIRGLVFYFWGSTDPNPNLNIGRQNANGLAFLCEGQHKYAFGWHKVSSKEKIYRALRPAKHGVLVFRDRDKNFKLTEKDRLAKIEPVRDINIHWSGVGTKNFSAGCQVISGQSYLTGRGELVDCSSFAARSYSELGAKTRGAYDLLIDLILTYAPAGVTTISYTLTKDEAVFLSDGLTKDILADVVKKMKEKS